MKPLEWPNSTRLPRPRTPLPAYITLPSAAATTGSPGAPSMSIPFVLALKPWMTLPLAGQPQLIRLASDARAAVVGGEIGRASCRERGEVERGGASGEAV